MKPRHHTRALLAALSFAMTLGTAHATSLTWDTSIAADGVITDGSGTWTNGDGNWNDGTTSVGVNWNNATPDSAIFGGTVGGTITVAAGGVTQAGMIFNGNGNYTVSGGAIGGAGSLTKNGTGTLTLSSSNSYTGGTIVSSGVLKLNAVGATGSGTITLNDSSTGSNNVGLDLSGFPVYGNVFATNVTVANLGSGTVTITLGAANFCTANTFTLNRATTFLANNTGTTYLGQNFGPSGGLITGNVGTLTLTETGTGTIAIGGFGANTYTGTTAITQGSVVVQNADAFGGTSNSLVMSGNASLSMGSALNTGDVTGVTANTITNSGNLLTISSANSATFAGAISGTGGLTKSGGGTQTLSGTNTFTGATTINGGTLALSNGTALANSNAVTLANTAGAILLLNTSETIGSLAGGGATGGNVTLGSTTLTLGSNNTDTSYAGVISGTGGKLIKTGTGTQTLTGTNTYDGGTTISAGTLKFTGDAAAPATGTITLGDASTGSSNVQLIVDNFTYYSGNRNITVANQGSGTATIALTTVNQSINGTITLNRATTITSSNSGGNAFMNYTSGKITGTVGTLTLTATGGGSLALGNQGTNDFVGSVVISQGNINTFNSAALGTTNSVGMSGTATLGLVASLTIGDLTGIATNTINTGSSTLTISSANSATFAGVIAGTGGLTKSLGGTQTLSGVNTYSGATTISGGTLKIGGSGSLNAGTYTGAITNTAALQYSSSANQTLSGVISGTGGTVTKDTGSGTLILSNTNTYSGTTTLSAGTLRGTLAGSFGSGALSLGGGTLELFSDTATAFNRNTTLTASAAITTSRATAGAGVTHTLGTLSIGAQTLTVNAAVATSGTQGLTFGATTLTGGATFNVTGGTLTLGAITGGTNSLTKSGSGTLVLGSANTYSGGTTVLAGTLKLSAVGASGSGTITLNDSSTGSNNVGLDLSNFPVWSNVFASNVTVANLGSGTVTITLGAANFCTANTFTLNRATTFLANNTGTTYLGQSFGPSGGLITGNVGTLTLTETGTGTIAIGHYGANTYTGTTAITQGSVTVANAGAFGGIGNSLVMSGTASLSMGSALNIGDVTGVTANTIANGGNLLTISSANSADFAGVISGTGALTKSGTGTQTLSGVNTYTGATTVNGGTLKIGGSGTLGSGSYAGNITNTAALQYSSSANQTLSGIISGTAGTLTKDTGSGTLILSGANTYTGVTTIAAGTLSTNSVVVSTGASGLGNATSAVVLGDATNQGILSYTGNAAIYTRGFTVNAGGGRINTTTAGQTLTLGTNNLTGAGALTIGGAGNTTVSSAIQTASLTKVDDGTLVLSGSNSYGGSTTLNGGKLYLNNSNSTGSISVAGGTTLGGSGSAASATATVATTGIVEAGFGGAGSLGLAGLTFSGNGSVNIATLANYTTNAAIQISASNGLTVSGAANSVILKLSGTAPVGTGTAHLLQYAGAIQGANGFAAFTLDTSAITGLGARSTLTLANPTGYVDLSYAVDHPVWTGALDGTWALATQGAPKNWALASNSLTPTDFIAGDAVEFTDGAINAMVTINGADVSPQSVTFNNATQAYTLTGTHGIAGATSLVKNAAGLLTIINTNSYSGGTTVSGGTLQLGDGTTNGVIIGNITNTANVTFNNGSAQTFAGSISGTGGSLTKIGSGTLTFTGNNTYTGGTTASAGILQFGDGVTNGLVTGNIVNTANVTFNNGSAQTFAGNISGTGGSLIKNGSGVLTLTGNNTYTGGTTVSAGTLNVGGGGSTGTLPSTSVAVASGATLAYDFSSDFTTAPLNVTGNLSYTSSTGILSLAGGTYGAYQLSAASTANYVDITGNMTINAGVGGATFTAASSYGIYSSGSRNINSTGNVTFTGTNTRNSYDCGINTAGVFTATTGTLTFDGTATGSGGYGIENGHSGDWSSSITTYGNVVFKGSGGTTRNSDLSLGDLTGNGTVTLIGRSKGLNNNSTFTATGGSPYNVSIQTTNGAGINGLLGAGTDNTGNGNYTINSAAGVTFGARTINAGTGTISLTSTTGYSITDNTTLQSAALTMGDTQGVVITSTKTLTLNTTGTIANIISGSGGKLTVTGGTITLSGVNTYTGATQVNGGILDITGSTAAGSALTVGGATATGTPTLRGSGTINGATTIAAAGGGAVGTHAPTAQASGSGQTFASTLTYGSGSIFEWNLNASTADTGSTNQGSYGQVIANGAVTGNAVFTVALGTNTFTSAFWDTTKSWDNIFATTGGGTFNLSSLFTTYGGADVASNGIVAGQGSFTINGTSLTWTAVPEPTSALAGLLLGAGLLRRRRK